MPQVFLSLGSNIDRKNNICKALDELYLAFNRLSLSSVYKTQAEGFIGEDFYNLVVGIDTDLDLLDIVDLLKQIEKKQGRDHTQKGFSSRVIDIDLLTYGDFVGEKGGVVLPRSEIYKFSFVLYPLVDLAGELICPKYNKSYAEILACFSGTKLLKKIDFSWKEVMLPAVIVS
jgi:2-amino-4-hydroxy-6-hydroxymethyldihydropteridine diphosphokinase